MKLLLYKLRLLLGVIFVTAFLSFIWLESDYADSFRVEAKNVLLNRLTSEVLPPDDKVFDVVYILGGSYKSLRYKYKTVAELYKNGRVNRIWILGKNSGPDFYEDSRSLGSEWQLSTLKKYGIPREKIELIAVDEGVFGTYSEARDVSQEIIKDSHTAILLVSSAHHTQRMKESFQNFISEQQGVNLYIKASDEQVYLREMISEYLKLSVYRLLFNDEAV